MCQRWSWVHVSGRLGWSRRGGMPRRGAARTPVRLVPSSSPWGSDGGSGDDEASTGPVLPAAPRLGSPTRSLGDDAGDALREAPSDRMATYFVAITTGTLAPEDEEYDWYVPPAAAAAHGGRSPPSLRAGSPRSAQREREARWLANHTEADLGAAVRRYREDLQTTFEELDSDGGGFLSQSELRQGLQAYGIHVSMAEMRGLMAAFDAADDDFIDWKEFLELMSLPASGGVQPPRRPTAGDPDPFRSALLVRAGRAQAASRKADRGVCWRLYDACQQQHAACWQLCQAGKQWLSGEKEALAAAAFILAAAWYDGVLASLVAYGWPLLLTAATFGWPLLAWWLCASERCAVGRGLVLKVAADDPLRAVVYAVAAATAVKLCVVVAGFRAVCSYLVLPGLAAAAAWCETQRGEPRPEGLLVDQGRDTPTTPHTDATVCLRLRGVAGDTTEIKLSNLPGQDGRRAGRQEAGSLLLRLYESCLERRQEAFAAAIVTLAVLRAVFGPGIFVSLTLYTWPLLVARLARSERLAVGSAPEVPIDAAVTRVGATLGIAPFSSAGQVDQFVVQCEDVGAVVAVRTRHENDGADWSTSRWKLGEVAVIRLAGPQSHGDEGVEGSRRANVGWHFAPAPGEEWIGCDPADTGALDRNIEDTELQLRDALGLVQELEERLESDRHHKERVLRATSPRSPSYASPRTTLHAQPSSLAKKADDDGDTSRDLIGEFAEAVAEGVPSLRRSPQPEPEPEPQARPQPEPEPEHDSAEALARLVAHFAKHASREEVAEVLSSQQGHAGRARKALHKRYPGASPSNAQ